MMELFRSNFWRLFSEFLTRPRYDSPQHIHDRMIEQFPTIPPSRL